MTLMLSEPMIDEAEEIDGRERRPSAKTTEQYQGGSQPPPGDPTHQRSGRHIFGTMPVGNGRIFGMCREDALLDAQACLGEGCNQSALGRVGNVHDLGSPDEVGWAPAPAGAVV